VRTEILNPYKGHCSPEGGFKFIIAMSIYDRDYYSQEREERIVKIEKSHTEIWVRIEQQEKMLDQLFDLIKLLREERKSLIERIQTLEEENKKLWAELEKLRSLIGE
jgi:septal ring factor EnvC (AmiA/AmiB activator)